MRPKQPQPRPGLFWVFVLAGCVLVTLTIAASKSRMGGQLAASASLPLVKARAANAGLPSLSQISPVQMAFEANEGQTDARVHYVAHGDGYTLFLTSDEAVISLASESALRMRIAGANSNPEVTASGVLPGVSNYFIGNNPRHWHTNVH